MLAAETKFFDPQLCWVQLLRYLCCQVPLTRPSRGAGIQCTSSRQTNYADLLREKLQKSSEYGLAENTEAALGTGRFCRLFRIVCSTMNKYSKFSSFLISATGWCIQVKTRAIRRLPEHRTNSLIDLFISWQPYSVQYHSYFENHKVIHRIKNGNDRRELHSIRSL